MEKQKPIFIKMDVTEKEKKLLEFIRSLEYGDFHLFVENKQPERAKVPLKSVKF